MTDETDPDLAALRDDYDATYHIWHYDGQPWSALARTGPIDDPFTADSAEGLRELLDADLATRLRPTDQGSL